MVVAGCAFRSRGRGRQTISRGQGVGCRTKQFRSIVIERKTEVLEEESEVLQFLQAEAAGTQPRARVLHPRRHTQATEEIVVIGESEDKNVQFEKEKDC